MPYGVKRGFKSPGEFSVGDITGLALSGAAGIVAALITDYQQQAEASALYTLNQWSVALGSLVGYTDIPLWWVIAGLIGVGAGSIFYFQPITRQGAFAQGFGLLAVLMTAIPSDLASGIEDIARDNNLPSLRAPAPGTFPTDVSTDVSFDANSFEASISSSKSANSFDRSNDGQLQPEIVSATLIQNDDGVAQYSVRLVIKFEEGLKGDVNSLIRRGLLRGRLHNDSTGETYNLFRTAGGSLTQQGDTLIIDAGVPARESEAVLWVRIECAGHLIEEQSATARLGEPLVWQFNVKKSSTPMFLQRLGKVYRY